MSDEGKIRLILLVFLIIVVLGYLFFYVYIPYSQEMRGPAIDLNIDVKIGENGNIEVYSLIAKMQDTYSYDEFTKFVNTQGYDTIKEYFFRDISSKTLFDYQYDSDKVEIEFTNTEPFDPNQEIQSLNYDRTNWNYYDSLYKSEYFIPDSYINSINYDLEIPAEVRETNGEILPKLLTTGNSIHWEIDRHKESPDYSSKEIIIPNFYANTSAPLPTPGFGLFSLTIGFITFLILIKQRSKIRT